jgi:hypothetical protein
MTMPTPTVVLPEVQLAEWSAVDTRTAPGLFAYRQMQAMNLLDFPDYGGGDLDSAQRKEALRRAISFHKPLSALSLFLGVVALEDFLRDLAARLADVPNVVTHFPALTKLRAQQINRSAGQMFKRLDTDPAGTLDPAEINLRFTQAMGVAPVPTQEYWHLRDLALLRHTIAHNAAVIRQIDLPRFAHFIVEPGRIINPPPDFIHSELIYLYGLGRTIEKAIRSATFAKVIAKAGAGWAERAPQAVIELIEFFGFFGYIESTNVAVGYSEPGSDFRCRQEVEAQRVRTVLFQKCVADLVVEHGA